MIDGAYYGITAKGNDTYTVNFTRMIKDLFEENGLSGTWSKLLSQALAGDSYVTLYLNGKGRSVSFEKLFNNANFSFYPRQVAARLAEANSSGKYNKIINKLNNAGLSWKALLGNDLEGDLGFDWGINSFEDFKEVLSVILSCIDPFIEILFAEKINVNDLIRFKKLGSIDGDLDLLWSIFLTLDMTLGLDLELGSFNLYQDVLVPIFEALGVSDFEFGNNYKFTNINYSSGNDRYTNAKNAVDKILDPVMTLVEQLAAHPLQKVLSILPNLALFLENGMALDLADIETSVDAIIDIDFNFDWESIVFNCMKKIINSIMKHWYDWLRPSKYAKWAAKTANIDLDKAIINDIVTDGSLDLDKIRNNIYQNDLLVILAELITPENKYSTVDMNWKSSVKMTGETSSYSEIPYLEYDNEWTKDFATTAVNDIDDVANSLIETLGLDLGEAENISQWLKKIFDDMVDGDILSALVKVLAGLGSGMTDDVSALVKKLVGLDLTQWGNDYGYLFTEASAPSSRNFPLLTGKANEDGTYSWVYNGKDVKTYKDVLAALGYVLSPLSKVTDAVLAGKDLKVLEYNKATASTGSVVTVKGTEGYSTAIIPLLESLGVNSDSILTQSEFNNYEGGSTAAFTYSASLLIEKVYSIIESEHPVAELMQLVIQVLYFLSSNGLGVVLNDIAHPIMVLIDIVRPLVSLDLDAIINDLVCEFTYSIGGYTNAEHMKKALELRKASLSIKDLSLEAVMKLAGVILSVSKDGTRKFLDLHTVTAAAIDDLAFLRTEKTSKALDENGNAKKYYEITISGADAFTSIVSFALEAVMFSSNAEIIDAFANSNGIVETAVKTVCRLCQGIDGG